MLAALIETLLLLLFVGDRAFRATYNHLYWAKATRSIDVTVMI